jgi:hypothetical protein
MVASAWASLSDSGPTTRSVGGASAGDADVAGGADGCSLEHAAASAVATQTAANGCIMGILLTSKRRRLPFRRPTLIETLRLQKSCMTSPTDEAA